MQNIKLNPMVKFWKLPDIVSITSTVGIAPNVATWQLSFAFIDIFVPSFHVERNSEVFCTSHVPGGIITAPACIFVPDRFDK